MDYLFLLLGFVFLIFGGDFLVKGASGIALNMGLTPMVVGLTIVSFGTSAPELIVSIKAALQQDENSLMSVGNVVGSNIANLSLVLGVTALISPILIKKISLIQDWPVLMLSSVLAGYFMSDLVISKWEGVTLFSLLIVFTAFLLLKSKKQNEKEDSTDDGQKSPVVKQLFLVAIGVVGLALGSEWMVDSASKIAASWGVSPFLIGVTILAFGTSVPELVTSGIAAYRGETDLAVGNLLGSNIFNILSVLGITAMIAPVPLTQSIFENDVVWMIGIAMLLFVLMLIRKNLNRLKGVLLILCYLAYIYFLFDR